MSNAMRPNPHAAKWTKQLNADRASLLQSPAFCRVMQDYLTVAGLFRISHAGENTHSTAFNEGNRNAALRLFADLETANPSALMLLRAHARPAAPQPDQPDE